MLSRVITLVIDHMVDSVNGIFGISPELEEMSVGNPWLGETYGSQEFIDILPMDPSGLGVVPRQEFNDVVSMDPPWLVPSNLVPAPVEQPSIRSDSSGCHVNWEDWSTLDDITYVVRSHEAVFASGLPNHLGCRLPVRSHLNIGHLKDVLVDYPDKEVVEFLEFGFPVRAMGPIPEKSPCSNHGGTLKYSNQIDSYIRKELEAGSIIGPFDSVPFSSKTVFSPLSTAEKKDSVKRRVVVDLSFPLGRSVNDMVPPGKYMGSPMNLHCPSVDDYNLLDFTWKGVMYFDPPLSMGLRSSPFLARGSPTPSDIIVKRKVLI